MSLRLRIKVEFPVIAISLRGVSSLLTTSITHHKHIFFTAAKMALISVFHL